MLDFSGVGLVLRSTIIAATQQDKWEALGITHYEIAVTEPFFSTGAPCEQRIEVANSNVNTVMRDDCFFLGSGLHGHEHHLTVEHLFERASAYRPRGQCLLGCACDRFVVTVTYDPVYHFPSELVFQNVGQSGIPALFGGCSATPQPSDVEVVDFKVLP